MLFKFIVHYIIFLCCYDVFLLVAKYPKKNAMLLANFFRNNNRHIRGKKNHYNFSYKLSGTQFMFVPHIYAWAQKVFVTQKHFN